jgi:hypothetical protein
VAIIHPKPGCGKSNPGGILPNFTELLPAFTTSEKVLCHLSAIDAELKTFGLHAFESPTSAISRFSATPYAAGLAVTGATSAF